MSLSNGEYNEVHPRLPWRKVLITVLLVAAGAGLAAEWFYHGRCHCIARGEEITLLLQPAFAEEEERIRVMVKRAARILKMGIKVEQSTRPLAIPPIDDGQKKCVVVVSKALLVTTNGGSAMYNARCAIIQLASKGYTESTIMEELRHLQAGHHCLRSQISGPLAGILKLVFDDIFGVVRINNWIRTQLAEEAE